MQNINGTNYISFQEYAQIKGKTVGRIYQLKNELPVVKFDDLGVELINYDLLQLSETEVNWTQSKIQTSHVLQTYDHKQLCLFFAEMIRGNSEARTNAETLLREKEGMMEEQSNTILELTEKNKSLDSLLSQAQEENVGLAESLQEKTDALEKADALISELHLEIEGLITDKQAALDLGEELKMAQQKLQSDFELKATENVGLMKEQTLRVAQISGLNKEIEKLQTGMENLTQEHRKTLAQKEDLNTALNDSKILQQKTLHDLELTGVEMKGLIKDNTTLQTQVVALNQKLQEEQSFNQRLGKLEELLLKENKDENKD